MKGLDIWYHQTVTDWKKVKASGIDFILPRDGWGDQKIDPKFVEHVQGAQKAGISVPGVFHFIYAISVEEAVQNAVRAIRNVKAAGLPKSTVIWCDLEYDTVDNAKKRGVILTAEDQKNFAEAFCNIVLAEGYCTGIYCNRDYLENIYSPGIRYDYDIWYADLEGDPDYPCLYRQYDWHGNVPGITEEVDLDEFTGIYTAGTAKPKKGTIMIKASELLKQIHDVVDNIPTVYYQCDNFGGWNPDKQAFNQDCIVWIKSMVYWNWYYPDKSKPHGGMTYRGEFDWTEPQILAHCSNVKYSGFLSAKTCEYLYMDGHGGFKIDEFTRDGKTYNAAECTWASAWGTPAKCVYSYVADDGARYSYKGGIRNGTWEAHGELYGVDYDEIMPTPEPAETTIPMIKFISFLPVIQKGSKGDCVKVLQNCLSVLGFYADAVDGSAGPNTYKAIIAYQTAAGLVPDGFFGPKSWSKLLMG